VNDYIADADARDMREAQLAGLRRSNSLADLAYQGQAQDIATKRQTQNAVQRIYADPANTDQVARENALLANPLTAAQGMAAQKQRLENANTAAQTSERSSIAGKNDFETRRAKADQAVKDISALQSPQEAAAAIQQHLAAGDIDQGKAQALLQSLPQDPAQLPTWQLKMVRGILTAKDQMEAVQPKPVETNLGNRKAFIDTNPQSPTYGKEVASAAVGQSPDNAATTGAHLQGIKLQQAGENLRAGMTPGGGVSPDMETTAQAIASGHAAAANRHGAYQGPRNQRSARARHGDQSAVRLHQRHGGSAAHRAARQQGQRDGAGQARNAADHGGAFEKNFTKNRRHRRRAVVQGRPHGRADHQQVGQRRQARDHGRPGHLRQLRRVGQGDGERVRKDRRRRHRQARPRAR
jgi:hypothetical protein